MNNFKTGNVWIYKVHQLNLGIFMRGCCERSLVKRYPSFPWKKHWFVCRLGSLVCLYNCISIKTFKTNWHIIISSMRDHTYHLLYLIF